MDTSWVWSGLSCCIGAMIGAWIGSKLWVEPALRKDGEERRRAEAMSRIAEQSKIHLQKLEDEHRKEVEAKKFVPVTIFASSKVRVIAEKDGWSIEAREADALGESRWVRKELLYRDQDGMMAFYKPSEVRSATLRMLFSDMERCSRGGEL